MDKETTKTIMQIRASDARSVVLPFVLSHIVILAILGFSGDGLGDSGVQFAMTTFLVLGLPTPKLANVPQSFRSSSSEGSTLRSWQLSPPRKLSPFTDPPQRNVRS